MLRTYMLDLHRDRVFPNKIQMIDLVLIVLCHSGFLQSILLPHVFVPVISSLSCVNCIL